MKKTTSVSGQLKGWAGIAKFLGQPMSIVQRWAKSGMPIRREGRNTVAFAEELNTG
ncbi:MAG: hypothetical protein M3O09_00775 [Acidobacteriota bacterium]|nr:hypothetical protein [Acidobacteriota bacterium]